MWRLIVAYSNVFFNYIHRGHLPLRTRRVQCTAYRVLHPDTIHPDTIHPDTIHPDTRRVQCTAYRVPYRTGGLKFKSHEGYVLSLSKDKQDVAIYVLNKTLKTFDLSKLKLLGIKMFYIKHSLSPNCMRAIFRLEEIQFPPKKNLLISQAAFKCFI